MNSEVIAVTPTVVLGSDVFGGMVRLVSSGQISGGNQALAARFESIAKSALGRSGEAAITGGEATMNAILEPGAEPNTAWIHIGGILLAAGRLEMRANETARVLRRANGANA